jgi:hypothetical protein
MNKRKSVGNISRSQSYKRLRNARERTNSTSSSDTSSNEDELEHFALAENVEDIDPNPLQEVNDDLNILEPHEVNHEGRCRDTCDSDDDDDDDIFDSSDDDDGSSDGGGSSGGDHDNNNGSSSEEEDEFDLRKSLGELVVKHVLPRTTTVELLALLRQHECFTTLPKTRETLVNSLRERVVVRDVAPGIYYHFSIRAGIIESLKKSSSDINNTNLLELFINVDGVSLAHSSRSQFISILGYVRNLKHVPVFKIGVYEGKSKPHDTGLYFEEFITEAEELIQNGLVYNGHEYVIRIVGFICDLPAKSFVLCTRGHNYRKGCSKCTVLGLKIHNRMCYNNQNAAARTDDSFRTREDNGYHIEMSPIERIPFLDIVQSFPIDPMHQLYTGAVKKVLKLLFGVKPNPHKLPLELKNSVSVQVTNIRTFITDDFQRLPREMDSVGLFKATEGRLFLLYVGPLVMRQILDGSQKNRDIYDHFVSLHVAATMLSRDCTAEEREYCEVLIRNYVTDFATLYGNHLVSQNIHALIHLCGDVTTFGRLEDFSAFKFENENRLIRRLLKQSPKPLQQLVRRDAEITANIPVVRMRQYENEEISKLHQNGPLINNTIGPEFKVIKFEKFRLKITKPNNIFMNNDNNIFKLRNIAHSTQNGSRILIAQQFLQLDDLYVLPRHSSSLYIYRASNLGEPHIIEINSVKAKCIGLPINQDTIAVFTLSHCL